MNGNTGRKASVVYEGNGTQTVFLFPFDYLRKAFIYAQDMYDGKTKDLTQGTDFEVDNMRQVRFTKPLAANHVLRIYRQTTTKPLVEWQDASVLRSADLTLQEIQLLHLAEETHDTVIDSAGLTLDPLNDQKWNANYKRIGNVLDPQDPQDVMTLNYAVNHSDGIINQIKQTGQSVVHTVNNARDTATQSITALADGKIAAINKDGASYVSDIHNKGTEQINSINALSTQKINAIQTQGDTYLQKQTQLKGEAQVAADSAQTAKEQSVSAKAFSKAWAVSEGSPDSTLDNASPTKYTLSSRSWALQARQAYAQAKDKIDTIDTTLSQATNVLWDVQSKQQQIQTDLEIASRVKDKAVQASGEAKAASDAAKTYKAQANTAADDAQKAADKAEQSAKKAATIANVDLSAYSTTAENDAKYLTEPKADKRYLQIIEANRTYAKTNEIVAYLNTLEREIDEVVLTKSVAKDLYMEKEEAQDTYLTKTDADQTYMKKTEGSGFLTSEEAAGRYLTKIDAMGKYATQEKLTQDYVEKEEFQQNLTDNGWSKLPNGLILQWGLWTAERGTSPSIVFPIAFPTKCFSVVTQVVTPEWDPGECCVWGIKKSGFIAGNQNTSSIKWSWLAAGY